MSKTIEEELDGMRDAGQKDKCVDLNYMIFNYGKFHNNHINQLIHIVCVPVILYSYYVMLSLLCPYWQLSFSVPIFGDRIGCGVLPQLILSVIYFFVDCKVALGVASWWWPTMVLANMTWMLY